MKSLPLDEEQRKKLQLIKNARREREGKKGRLSRSLGLPRETEGMVEPVGKKQLVDLGETHGLSRTGRQVVKKDRTTKNAPNLQKRGSIPRLRLKKIFQTCEEQHLS